MGTQTTIVDKASSTAIAAAIKKVNQTPGLRIRTGAEALWTLFRAPNHSMARGELDKRFGAFDLHFGWFCRRVAEELGVSEPDALALVDYSNGKGATQVLTLKSSVVAAMQGIKAPPQST
jgi:hypothetical protein